MKPLTLLFWLLVLAGAVLIVTPPMLAPHLTQMLLLSTYWKMYLAGAMFEAGAIITSLMDDD